MTFQNRIKVNLKSFMLQRASKAKYKFILKDWNKLFDLELCSQILETKRFSQNLQPIQLESIPAKRILVISPHPDDDILGAGGTLIKSIKNGAEVYTVYVTNACRDHQNVASIKNETMEVCEQLGARPFFFDYEAKKIPIGNLELKERLSSLIRKIGPDKILIPFLLDDHDDHRCVNQLLYSIRNEISSNIEVWSYQIYTTVLPNVVVDITEEVKFKRKLIKIWKSVRGNRDWAHYVLGMNAMNCRYIPGEKEVYAESFFTLPISEYLELCEKYFGNPVSKIYYTDYYRSL